MTRSPEELWTPQETFGDRLRRVRRAVKLNQREFALRLGEDVSAQAVAAWELGTREPRGLVALSKRIELAYGVPAGWMLGVEQATAPRPNGPEGGEGLPRLDSNQQPSGHPFTQVSVLRAVA